MNHIKKFIFKKNYEFIEFFVFVSLTHSIGECFGTILVHNTIWETFSGIACLDFDNYNLYHPFTLLTHTIAVAVS